MKLNLVKANIFTIPNAARTVLNILKQPFFFTRCNGVVYMNEDMDKLDETAAAIASWWENTQADPTEENVAAYDAAWNAIKEFHGEEAAEQISRIHRDSAKEYREKQSTKEAREWLQTVWENLTEEQSDAMWEAGYRSRTAEAMFRAMTELDKEGVPGYSNYWGNSYDAAGIYGFLLGMEYGKKNRGKELGAMSDREKLIAEITEGLNDLDEKTLEVVRDYVLLPFAEE